MFELSNNSFGSLPRMINSTEASAETIYNQVKRRTQMITARNYVDMVLLNGTLKGLANEIYNKFVEKHEGLNFTLIPPDKDKNMYIIRAERKK